MPHGHGRGCMKPFCAPDARAAPKNAQAFQQIRFAVLFARVVTLPPGSPTRPPRFSFARASSADAVIYFLFSYFSAPSDAFIFVTPDAAAERTDAAMLPARCCPAGSLLSVRGVFAFARMPIILCRPLFHRSDDAFVLPVKRAIIRLFSLFYFDYFHWYFQAFHFWYFFVLLYISYLASSLFLSRFHYPLFFIFITPQAARSVAFCI